VTRVPVVPKPAATVLLVRDDPAPPPGRTPLQVFLQRRVAGMAFAGGMTVFPGGGVDPSDQLDVQAWVGPTPAEWGQRLGHPPELAGALVKAAVRETYEECGVLLAGHGPVALPDGVRADLVAHRRALPDVLGERALRADLMRAWSRWITPPPSPKRYDTAFLVAQVPEGQVADAHTTEAVEARWWHPAEALERWQAGEIALMAPTFTTLREIDEHPDCAAVLTAADLRDIEPVRPQLRRTGAEVDVVLPGDPDYRAAAHEV
jgi:8-oxo-dGTP pyrophosphatase MutT (NUDIX family)